MGEAADYVELRALKGLQWPDSLPVASRLATDAKFTHMSGPERDNPLAYLDYSQLIEVLGRHWVQFEKTLMERSSWDGRQPDLQRIRHRIGHMRQSHRDDVTRIEQSLRDLELGAFIAYSSYNRQWRPDPDAQTGAVVDGWINEQHETAQRLIAHADRQYETRMSINCSRRPWANLPTDLDGAPGILWHVDFYMRGRALSVGNLWRDSYMDGVKPLLLHLLVQDPYHATFVFAAIDDPSAITDAIGSAFDAVLTASRPAQISLDDDDSWKAGVGSLDYRVLTDSGWGIVDETMRQPRQ